MHAGYGKTAETKTTYARENWSNHYLALFCHCKTAYTFNARWNYEQCRNKD